MAAIDEVERRAELAAKVAMLEERSVNGQKQLDRIEEMLSLHAKEEESLLRGIHDSLHDFKETIEGKITSAIEPLKADLTRYKSVIGFIGSLFTVIITIATFFKDTIASWFK